MENLPFWAHIAALVLLLFLSAFFSISETSMMALNRYRLGHLVKEGRPGAGLAASLLGRTDSLLGTILLGNNVVNTALTALVTSLAIRYFGNEDAVVAAATAIVAALLIVFCEITPKVLGATHPERIALPASYPLAWLIRISSPVVAAINVIAMGLLRLFGFRTETPEHRLSPQELRTLVLESGHYIPQKHRSILMNLFDLENITVDDVMTPRNRIEALDITAAPATLLEQLTTCYHNKIPVYEGEVNRVIGILHVRKSLSLVRHGEFTAEDLRQILTDPYFVPSGTPVFTQLQFFQENRQRVALIVDEYGEIDGLVTLEDIVEEMVGEFTTHAPGAGTAAIAWNDDGEAIVEGSALLRDLNRHLGLNFPLDGPRTLNGLILELLRELPEEPVSIRIGDIVIEIQQIQNRTVRSARLRRIGIVQPG
ncbi:MAG: HlyC/CorC family transporter [Burkholderiales bacterium]|nr:MAG: HlyC/CorC family transporter [Burkholderiales bacterium]